MQKHEVRRAQKGETKLKEKLKVNSLFGMIKNLEGLYQRVMKKSR